MFLLSVDNIVHDLFNGAMLWFASLRKHPNLSKSLFIIRVNISHHSYTSSYMVYFHVFGVSLLSTL